MSKHYSKVEGGHPYTVQHRKQMRASLARNEKQRAIRAKRAAILDAKAQKLDNKVRELRRQAERWQGEAEQFAAALV